jgi:hypothetical protein
MNAEQTRHEVPQTDGHIAVTTYHAAGGVSYRTGFQTKAEASAWIRQARGPDSPDDC